MHNFDVALSSFITSLDAKEYLLGNGDGVKLWLEKLLLDNGFDDKNAKSTSNVLYNTLKLIVIENLYISIRFTKH